MTDEKEIESTYFPFSEGMPTKPDVDLLLETWSDPKVGDRFPYESIEKLLRVSCRDSRFWTIKAAWARRLKQQFKLTLYTDRNEAFYIAAPAQIIGRTVPKMTHVVQTLKHHRSDLLNTKPDNELQAATRDHQVRLSVNLERDIKRARMNTLPSTVQPEKPRLSPPKEKNG